MGCDGVATYGTGVNFAVNATGGRVGIQATVRHPMWHCQGCWRGSPGRMIADDDEGPAVERIAPAGPS